MRVITEENGRKAVLLPRLPEKRQAFRQIAQYAFELSQYTNPNADNDIDSTIDNIIAVYNEDDELVAGLELVLSDIYIKGKPIGHGGIASVCSLPWARRKGNVRLAIKASLAYLRSLNKPVSALYPFSFSFYRQFGWELGQRNITYRIPISELAGYEKHTGSFHKVNIGNEEDTN